MLIGNTGSGKTNAAKVILWQASTIPNAQISICDYKGEDFSALEGSDRYSSFNECMDGLNHYYAEFATRQSGADTSCIFKLLAFDEWASFLNMLDKKDAEEAKRKLGTLLMLGRSFNFHILIIQQRADTSYFAAGARDQFSLICALGNISRESAQMIGFDREKMEPVTNAGEGHLLINGAEQKAIAFPFVGNNATAVNHAIAVAVNR